MFEFISTGVEDTERLGLLIGQLLNGGEVLCFTGDLGAGKTTLTKSIALGLGVEDYVTSPTFTIVNEYEGRVPLYHFDVYRIGDVDEIYHIGYEDYIYSDGVSIIEWANIIKTELPEERLEMTIRRLEENMRAIMIIPFGEKYVSFVQKLKEAL